MLITSKPCSTAQRRPPSRTGAAAREAGAEHADARQTRTRARARGRSRRRPCRGRRGRPRCRPTTAISPSSPRRTATAPSTDRRAGGSRSTPLSRMQTTNTLAGRFAEGPVARDAARASRRRSRSGSPAPAGRLQAGRSAGSLTARIVSATCQPGGDGALDHAGLRLDAFGLQRAPRSARAPRRGRPHRPRPGRPAGRAPRLAAGSSCAACTQASGAGKHPDQP